MVAPVVQEKVQLSRRSAVQRRVWSLFDSGLTAGVHSFEHGLTCVTPGRAFARTYPEVLAADISMNGR